MTDPIWRTKFAKKNDLNGPWHTGHLVLPDIELRTQI